MITPLHNLHLKVLALLAAIVLWFFVVGIENTVYSLPETIEIQPLGIGKTVSLASPLPKVKLYLRVDEKVLKTLTKNDFDISADLKGLSVGEYKVPVTAVSKNSQVRVLKVEPPEIAIQIAPMIEKEVDVVISFLGSPAQGYTVKELTAEVLKVKITGAQNIIDNISSVKAELLLNGTETENLKQNVTLQMLTTATIPQDGVEIIPEQILVSAVIITQIEQKIVKIKPVITGTADLDSIMQQIVLNPATVTIQGEEKYLSTVSLLATKPVDVQSLINSAGPLNLQLILPEKVSLLNPDEKVTISFTNQAAGQQSNQAAGQQSNPAAGQQSNQAAGQQSNPAAGQQSNQAAGQQSNQAAGQQSNPAPLETTNSQPSAVEQTPI